MSKAKEILEEYGLLHHQQCSDDCGNKGTEIDALKQLDTLFTEQMERIIGEDQPLNNNATYTIPRNNLRAEQRQRLGESRKELFDE